MKKPVNALKVGIIGCGMIARVRHAPEYDKNPHVVLTAYYDNSLQRAEDLAHVYGGKAYDNLDEMLKSGLDMVSVCVANADHAAVSIRALNQGIHVLCEKPMAMSRLECEQMLSAAHKNNRLLLIGHNQRLTPTHQKARQLIQSGALGRVLGFRTSFGHAGPEYWVGLPDPWFFSKQRAVFGVLADLGIHKLDILHYLLGEYVTQVSAFEGTLHKRWPTGEKIDVEDNAVCLLRTASGALGTAQVSWTFYGEEDNATVLYGEKGILSIYSDPEYPLILDRMGKKPLRFAAKSLDLIVTNEEQTDESAPISHSGVIAAFVEAVQTQTPGILGADEALAAMRVAFAAMTSIKEGRAVTIDHHPVV